MKYFGGKIFSIFALGFILCPGFFIAQKCSADSIVAINEIAWMGSTVSANGEWIELKNLSSAEIDLAGWTLSAAGGSPKINLSGAIPASSYFLLERTSDESASGVTADLIYSGALGNSGEILELKDRAGNLVDAVDASGGWPAGDNITKQTMERKGDGSWQTSVAVGGTPKADNSGKVGEQEPDDKDSSGQPQGDNSGETGGGSGSTVNIGFSNGAVVINEFVSSPSAGESEWIELYNPGGKELSLDGWTLADGSGAATVLSGGFSEDDYYFFVFEKPKGALNNSGDEIILSDKNHNIIDKVFYGKFGDQPDNNAPAPGKGESGALKIDGQKGSSDKDGFAVSLTPTKGGANIISAPENNPEAAAGIAPEKIAITEIMPNPIDSDRNGEFIEFFNSSDKELDLTGWRVEIENGRVFEFGKFFNVSRVLKAGEYFALYRAESNLVLDNNGGNIRLFAPAKSKAAQLLEYGPAPEGASFCDTEKIDLKNISSSTKNYLRNSLMVNRWVWSEAPTPGGANQIKIANQPPKIIFSAPDKITTGAFAVFDASDSYDENGDALAYVWDFGDGAPINLEMPAHIFYKPGNYKIKLAVSDGQVSSVLEKIFKVGGLDLSPKENIAANKTAIVLKDNSIDVHVGGNLAAKSVSRDSAGANKNAGVKNISSPAIRAVVASAVSDPAVLRNSISGLKLGAAWKISGTVIVLPGIFGVQYFYILPGGGAVALKIYNYYKDFPALALGDKIQAAGVVGGSEADKYLKTKSRADIKILGQAENIAPEKIAAADFTEENLGKFVQSDGEVESKSGTEIILDDGTGKINLYLKASAKIDSKRIRVGQKITASGLLSKVSSGLAILPRGDFDLVIATSSESAEAGLALGAATGSGAWTMPARKNGRQPFIYGLIIAGGAIIVLAGFLTKKHLFK
jgi:hypothetical protein